MKRLLLLLLLLPLGAFAQFELQSLYPTSDVSGWRFGRKVAVSGTDIAVATATKFGPVQTAGKVYVFNSATNTQQVLFPDDATPSDDFGATLAMLGDHLVVGAPYSGDTGAVYVYTKTDGTWVQTQKLTFPIGSSGQRFGIQVVLNSDFLFVSNVFDPIQSNPVQGSIVAYHLENGSFTFFQQFGFDIMNETAQLAAENGRLGVMVNIDTAGSTPGWRFRSYVQSPSNWTTEGDSDSFGGFGNWPRAMTIANGEAYILFNSMPVVSEVATLNWNGTAWEPDSLTNVQGETDQFFSSLVISGDYMAVGSDDYFFQIARKFPVLLFQKAGGTWNSLQTLYGDGPFGQDDFFGSVMATDGEKIAIGAPWQNQGIPTGKAYYFDTTLGVTSSQKPTVHLFPNPTDGPISIEGADVTQVEVFSITGQKLRESTLVQPLSVADLPSGIYMLRITLRDGTSLTRRLIRK